jgi:hypothetical protein
MMRASAIPFERLEVSRTLGSASSAPAIATGSSHDR